MAKTNEFKVSIQKLHVYFEQAYDSLDRDAFFSIFRPGYRMPDAPLGYQSGSVCLVRVWNINETGKTFESDVNGHEYRFKACSLTPFPSKLDGTTLFLNLALKKVARALSIN